LNRGLKKPAFTGLLVIVKEALLQVYEPIECIGNLRGRLGGTGVEAYVYLDSLLLLLFLRSDFSFPFGAEAWRNETERNKYKV